MCGTCEPKFDANAGPRIPCGQVLFLSLLSLKRVVPAVSRRIQLARGSCPDPSCQLRLLSESQAAY